MTAEQRLGMKTSVWVRSSGKNTQTKCPSLPLPFFLDARVFFLTKKCISEMYLENPRQDCLYPHKSEEVVLLPGNCCCLTYSYSKRLKGLGSGLQFQLYSRSIEFRSQETSFEFSSDLQWVNCVNFFNSCSFGLVDRVNNVSVSWWVGLDAIILHQLGVCLSFSPGSCLIRALCVGIVCVRVNQCKQLIATCWLVPFN